MLDHTVDSWSKKLHSTFSILNKMKFEFGIWGETWKLPSELSTKEVGDKWKSSRDFSSTFEELHPLSPFGLPLNLEDIFQRIKHPPAYCSTAMVFAWMQGFDQSKGKANKHLGFSLPSAVVSERSRRSHCGVNVEHGGQRSFYTIFWPAFREVTPPGMVSETFIACSAAGVMKLQVPDK